MQQNSPEWMKKRCGKVTASRIADMMAKTKTGWGASRANYLAQLVAERLTGVPAEGYTNAAMQYGIDTEPQARAAYEYRYDVTVQQVGFIDHPTIPMSGASPDGLISVEGLLEIKCPNTATHIETLLAGVVPSKYVLQMQWQMACTDRKWCDYWSFDNRMPPNMQVFVQRIERDPATIASLQVEVLRFQAEIAITVKQLQEKYAA